MHTYEIWVGSRQYHGKTPLTYTSINKLKAGSIVKVSIRNRTSLGVVRREATAPKGVAMKPVSAVLFDGAHRLPAESLKLLNWLLQYYPSRSSSIAQLFLPPSWPPRNIEIPSKRTQPHQPTQLPELTPEQHKVLASVRSHKATSFLLHGDTGSGKTRIYIELIADSLAKNKSCLILVPEIGLTPHIQRQLAAVFNPDNIKVFHSGLSPMKRRSVWLEILTATTPLIVIGPRSAIFAPLSNIGLVVIDECHDEGYKQSNAPYYSGTRAASRLAQLHNATTIYGSATPSISDMFIAQQKKIPILRMTSLAKNPAIASTEAKIISKLDRTEFTRSRYISRTLLDAISSELSKSQQSLLFLNRRGSARVIACSNCGWQAICPNCDLPLTLHADNFTARCHTCGYSQGAPTSCQDCKSPDVTFYGPGTKALEEELTKFFPQAKIARFDADNTVSERLDKHLNQIESGSIDIIIGTQVLIKGFDIPQLGLVGIVDADTSLSFPDFSTEEKTFQLINQAAGRIGRGHTPGKVIIQTFRPDNPLILQALKRDWSGFYESQLRSRKTHNFPPYTFLLKLECARKNPGNAETSANLLKARLTTQYPNVSILGPAPSFQEKQKGLYNWQLVIKSNRRSVLIEIIESLPSGWKYDIDPLHLL